MGFFGLGAGPGLRNVGVRAQASACPGIQKTKHRTNYGRALIAYLQH